MNPLIEAFLDEDTETISYVVADAESLQAVIIDPVLGPVDISYANCVVG